MSEKTDYKRFKDGVMQPGDRVDRIENWLVKGMPDLNFCISGSEGWIEQKHAKEPKRATTPLLGSSHRVSQNQMNWMLRQRAAGGRCFFLMCTDRRWMLIHGVWADDINKMTVAKMRSSSAWESIGKRISASEFAELREVLQK